jgi:hypothetical protein
MRNLTGQARWAEKSDSRVTRVGGRIRQVRIDELPRILGVLKGETRRALGGLVRCEDPLLSRALLRETRHHRLGAALLPATAPPSTAMDKRQYDLHYVNNPSLLLDFMVLFQTEERGVVGSGRTLVRGFMLVVSLDYVRLCPQDR